MSYGDAASKITASRLIIIAIAIGAIGAIGFYLVKERAAKDDVSSIPTQVTKSSDEIPKMPAKPTYTEPKPILEAVPELNESDPALLSALKNLNGSLMGDLLVPNEIIRKFVRAVDGVDDGRVVTDYRPVKSPQGAFVVDAYNVKVSGGEVGEVQSAEQFRVSPKNNLRYSLFVQSLSLLETDAGIAVYKRFYPLMNKAYRELGVKKDNFHSVMIRAIDRALGGFEIRRPSPGGDEQQPLFVGFACCAWHSSPQHHLAVPLYFRLREVRSGSYRSRTGPPQIGSMRRSAEMQLDPPAADWARTG